MGWHTNMTGEEIMAEARKEREREISKLRALARHYNAEADRLERIGKPSALKDPSHG